MKIKGKMCRYLFNPFQSSKLFVNTKLSKMFKAQRRPKSDFLGERKRKVIQSTIPLSFNPYTTDFISYKNLTVYPQVLLTGFSLRRANSTRGGSAFRSCDVSSKYVTLLLQRASSEISELRFRN